MPQFDPKREPWWVWLWAVWGLLLAAAVGGIDRSLSEAVVCGGAGMAIGWFGMQWWSWATQRFRPYRDLLGTWQEGSTLQRELAEAQLTLFDPKRMRWELYPGTVLFVGPIHGLLLGGPLGALAPLVDQFNGPSWQSALIGCVAGPLLACGLYAIIFPIIIITILRGPSIEKLRPVMRDAADEVDRFGHQFMSHEHLLLALVRHPRGAVYSVLEDLAADTRPLIGHLIARLPEQIPPDFDEQDFERGPYGLLHDATQRAKASGDKQVDPGHLLLVFFDRWPELTRETFAASDVDVDSLRKRINQSLANPPTR